MPIAPCRPGVGGPPPHPAGRETEPAVVREAGCVRISFRWTRSGPPPVRVPLPVGVRPGLRPDLLKRLRFRGGGHRRCSIPECAAPWAASAPRRSTTEDGARCSRSRPLSSLCRDEGGCGRRCRSARATRRVPACRCGTGTAGGRAVPGSSGGSRFPGSLSFATGACHRRHPSTPPPPRPGRPVFRRRRGDVHRVATDSPLPQVRNEDEGTPRNGVARVPRHRRRREGQRGAARRSPWNGQTG